MDKVVGWIHDGWIYSRFEEASGRFRIHQGWIWDEQNRDGRAPSYWIVDGFVYGPVGAENTISGYQIEDSWLYGPSMRLPFGA